jgi:hypothetical protein
LLEFTGLTMGTYTFWDDKYTDRQGLIKDLEKHRNSIQDKTGEKYQDKRTVLQAAIDYLNQKISLATLERALTKHPKYNTAILGSTTSELIEKVRNFPTIPNQEKSGLEFKA